MSMVTSKVLQSAPAPGIQELVSLRKLVYQILIYQAISCSVNFKILRLPIVSRNRVRITTEIIL